MLGWITENLDACTERQQNEKDKMNLHHVKEGQDEGGSMMGYHG